jgi:hypothetical protein
VCDDGSRKSDAANFFQTAHGNLSALRYIKYSVQAKLKEGRSNDPFEQEAQRTAERVMNIPDEAVREKPT